MHHCWVPHETLVRLRLIGSLAAAGLLVLHAHAEQPVETFGQRARLVIGAEKMMHCPVMPHFLGLMMGDASCACADWLADCGRPAGAACACGETGGGVWSDVSWRPKAAADEDGEDGAPPGHASPAGACGQCSCRGRLQQVWSPPLRSKTDRPNQPSAQPTQSACSCPAATLRPEPRDRALAIGQAPDAMWSACLLVCLTT